MLPNSRHIQALQADAEACAPEQVISEYRKARSLMDSMGAPGTKSVWHKLFTEVEAVRHRQPESSRDACPCTACFLEGSQETLG